MTGDVTVATAGRSDKQRSGDGNGEETGRAPGTVIGIAFLASALMALFGLAIKVSGANG
jgi:hypothetical protein